MLNERFCDHYASVVNNSFERYLLLNLCAIINIYAEECALGDPNFKMVQIIMYVELLLLRHQKEDTMTKHDNSSPLKLCV